MDESFPPRPPLLSDSDGPTMLPSTDTNPALHPIVAAAQIVGESSSPSHEIHDEPPNSVPSAQKTTRSEDLDVFYDISHVSHDHKTAENHAPEQGLTDKSTEQAEQIQLQSGAQELEPLTEVEVWDVVDSTGKHNVATVITHETTSDENAIIDDEDVEAATVAAIDAPESPEQVQSPEDVPLWVIIAGLTIWCCFIILLVGIVYLLAHSINWDGLEPFTAVELPLPSKVWLEFFHLAEGFSLTQAKGIDFAAAAFIAPVVIACANFVWFKIGRRLSPKTDTTTELRIEETGTFNVTRLFDLTRTSKPQLILLALLLFSSALASTLLSNVLGYKAIPPHPSEEVQSNSEEFLYQIVYIPGLLLPALFAITFASTSAFLIVVLKWRSVLKKRKQSQEVERGQEIVTDEHDVGCEATSTHNYVSFPRFHAGRRLFSRGGREIFNTSRRGTSGEGETEPLLQGTLSQAGSLASPGSWRLPLFEFPTFTLRKKVGDVEQLRGVGDVAAPPEQQVDVPRSSSAPWKLPNIIFPVWRRTQSAPIALQHAEDQTQYPAASSNVLSEVQPASTATFVRKGRKFWRLPSYGAFHRDPEIVQISELAAGSVPGAGVLDSEIVDVRKQNSLWKLPFPATLVWPSGTWRSERRNRQREEASETSSLLSQVERDDVILPPAQRTPSFWVVPSSTGQYTAPPPRIPPRVPSVVETPTEVVPNDHETPKYPLNSRPSWIFPRLSLRSLPKVISGGIEAPISGPANVREVEALSSAESTSGLSQNVSPSQVLETPTKNQNLRSFSWFLTFKFPLVLVDMPPRETKRPTLLPAFEPRNSKKSENEARALTASEALNIAIGNQPTSSHSRNVAMKGPKAISSEGYKTNSEAMTYYEPDKNSSKSQIVENVHSRAGKYSELPSAAVARVDGHEPPPRRWMPWIRFPTLRSYEKQKVQLQPNNITSSQFLVPSPSIVASPTKKGKEIEQYVDQFESTIEHVHQSETPVVIRKESIVMQPAGLNEENDEDEAQKSNPTIEWTPGTSRLMNNDVEAAKTNSESPSTPATRVIEKRTWLAPQRDANNATQTSPSPSAPKETPSSWKVWTWWDTHLIDIDSSRPASTASLRNISASSTISIASGDLEAQKHTPAAKGLDLYPRKRPLWGLGRTSYQLPQPSPVSVILPGYFSPGKARQEIFGQSGFMNEERGDPSSGTQLLIEDDGPRTPKGKGKEPMWSQNHDFRVDEEFWVGESDDNGRNDRMRRESNGSERSVGKVDTEHVVEMKGYLGF